MRCLACSSVQLKELISGGVYRHSTISSLRASAFHGCDFCEFFLTSLSRVDSFDTKDGRSEIVLRYTVYEAQYTSAALQLLVVEAGAEADTALISVELEICSYSGSITIDPARSNLNGRIIDNHFSKQRCQELAREWYTKCQATHDWCANDDDEPPPTRLLRVRMDSNPKMQLCLSSSLPKVKYVALSHCWGKFPLLTTTTQNLSTHLEGIPFDILPRNFQDAATITCAMGLEYLWIDSLCILQDSKEDWEKESAMMGQVYENSSFTIAADSSTNSHEGILHEREHAKVHMFFPQEVGFTKEDLYVRATLKEFAAIEDEPLNTRGWTCQERILSARLLHVTREQIFWECRDCVWAECTSEVLQDRMVSYNKRYHDNPKKSLLARLPKDVYTIQKLDVTHRPEAWYMSIVSFSRRRLTYPSDKLPAISGLARNFSDPSIATGGAYLAGLWENDFLRSMAWVKRASVKPEPQESEESGLISELTRAKSYRAPSFSWAAYDGPIFFPRQDILPLSDSKAAALTWVKDALRRYQDHRSRSTSFNIKLLESRMMNNNADPYGSLDKKSSILVEGTCLSFSYEPKTQVTLCGGKVPCSLNFDVTLEEGNAADYSFLQISREVPRVWLSEEVEEEVYCVILSLAKEGREMYQRVGTAQFPKAGELDSSWTRRKIVLR